MAIHPAARHYHNGTLSLRGIYQSGLEDDLHLILDWGRTENRSKLFSPFFSIQNRQRVVSNVEPSVKIQIHLITLSVRASTLGGIVRPICFAAFKLTMNSNFVGCSTGRSAGLAPFKILST